jgi:hypothetical protein
VLDVISPSRAVVLVAALLAVVVYLWANPANPPGMFQDEAAIALDAATIADTGRDQHGALLPVFFQSMDDYKSPAYVYVLAGVFVVTGPSEEAARALSALLVLGAVGALAWLAFRLTRRVAVAVGVLVLAASLPWFFDLSRLVFEVALTPLSLALVLLAAERAWRLGRWRARDGIVLGVALAGVAYTYAGARLLTLLVALAVPLLSGLRLRFLAGVYGALLAGIAPIVAYALRHPGALTSRLADTTFVEDGMGRLEIVQRLAINYRSYWDLPGWLTTGDPISRHHVPGVGSLSWLVVVLAAGSCVLFVARRVEWTPFWRFAVAMTLAAPVPAAVTGSEQHSLRAVAMPVCLIALTIPALDQLVALAGRVPRSRVALAAGLVAVVWAVGTLQYADAFRRNGLERFDAFHAGVPALIEEGLARDGRMLVPEDDLVAQNQVLWHLTATREGRERMETLPADASPTSGELVFGSTDECPFDCLRVESSNRFWLAEPEA